MAEILQILAQPIYDAGKWLAASIKRQFIYYFCFNSNIRSLRDEAQKLDVARATLQMQVDAKINNAQVIVTEVDDWFEKTNQIQEEKNEIELDIPNVQKGCLSLMSRIPLSKKAKKTAESMKELRDGCHFDPLAVPPPPQSTKVPKLTELTCDFESRKDMEERIMEAMRDGKVNLIGLCGMGGIGKTNMAKKLRKRVMEERLFDESVMVAVSQTVNIFGIQTKIAEQLGIEDFKALESTEARAYKLSERLGGPGKILVVVDDIWEEVKLEEDVGIPCGNDSKGCTVLLTSRTADVLKQMDVKVFKIDHLYKSEAWLLFRKIAGTCADDESLVDIAKDVVNECNGLPIAIVTIGSALKDEEIPIWKNARDRLKAVNLEPDMMEKIHVPLRLSYDFLKDPEAQLLFLLCSLFPEDSNIYLSELAWCSMELKIIGGISNREQARNRVFTITKKLKSRFLLLDGFEKHTVKMHDVIRDMAIYIAKDIRLDDSQSGSVGQFDVDSKGILQPRGSDQLSLDHLKGPKSSTYVSLESRKDLEDKIINTMRHESGNMIGILGMSGTGKSTMARRLRQRGMEENLFDETVMVPVGYSMMNIQLEIAEQLGCEEDLRNVNTLEERANKLSSRLGGDRRILIVLDDIWESIKLKDAGIPCGNDSKGCTVLLISRSSDVMRGIIGGKAMIFRVNELSQSEAWCLFKEKAGTSVDDQNLMPIAKEVANACERIPMAIVIVGSFLKDKEMSIWKDALYQLKSRFDGSGLFGALSLSYKYLGDPEAKSLLVLCSLFPEDSYINMEDLALYSKVFKIFGGGINNNVDEARKRVGTIAKEFKSCHMLDGDRENHVQMHNVFIAFFAKLRVQHH